MPTLVRPSMPHPVGAVALANFCTGRGVDRPLVEVDVVRHAFDLIDLIDLIDRDIGKGGVAFGLS